MKRLALVITLSIVILLVHLSLRNIAMAASADLPSGETVISMLLGWGDKVASWVLALFGSVLTGYVIRRYMKGTAAEILARALSEIFDAVLEVKQTYVDSLKDASRDGKLTSPEMREARERAISIAKSNLGVKGLARLSRILGVDNLETWLTTKVESAIGTVKITAPSTKAPASSSLLPKPVPSR